MTRDKLKPAVVGLGKMGLSHFAMVNAHPDVAAVACDGSGFMVDVPSRNISAPVYRDFEAVMCRDALKGIWLRGPFALAQEISSWSPFMSPSPKFEKCI